MAIFTAFLDESGTHADSPVTVMAGYVSTMKKWELFEKAAAPILSDYGVSVIHASKLFKSKKWTEEKKTAFIGEIAVLMKRYVLFGISVTVDDKAYRRVIKTRPVRKPDSEYAACFRVCMLFIPRLIRDARIDHDPTVNFVIEAGPGREEAVRLFQTSKPSNTVLANQLLGLNLVDKQRFIATQLADLLAYLSYQHAKDFVVT